MILEDRLKPYVMVAINVTRLSREEMPWIFPNCLFRDCISCECGAGSQLCLPSFFSVTRPGQSAFLGLVQHKPDQHTLRPSLCRNRVGDRETVDPVDQSSDKHGDQRDSHVPTIGLVQQRALDTARRDQAAWIRQCHCHGQDRLHAKVGWEEGALQYGELRSLEGLECGGGIDEGLRARTIISTRRQEAGGLEENRDAYMEYLSS